jgi:hypothetical protein
MDWNTEKEKMMEGTKEKIEGAKEKLSDIKEKGMSAKDRMMEGAKKVGQHSHGGKSGEGKMSREEAGRKGAEARWGNR